MKKISSLLNRAIIASIILIVMFSFTAHAEMMRFLRIKLYYEPLVETVDLDAIRLRSDQKGYSFSYSFDKDNSTYEQGDELMVSVTVKADAGTDFTELKAASCKLNGEEAVSLKVAEDGRQVRLSFCMPALPVKLRTPSNLTFDREGMARWDAVPNADGYELEVQRINDSGARMRCEDAKTETNEADLGPKIYKKKGDYLYTVKAVSDLYWLKDSDEAELGYGDSVLLSQEDIGYPSTGFKKDGTYEIDGEPVKDALIKIEGKWYYFGADGKMKKGWKHINGDWYYFEDDYRMAKGTRSIEERTYFFDTETGKMRTGFVMTENGERFFGNDGVERTGWIKCDGKTYFLYEDGSRCREQLIDKDNRAYLFNENGELIE